MIILLKLEKSNKMETISFPQWKQFPKVKIQAENSLPVLNDMSVLKV
jgi:hypothetical protein